MASRGAGRRDKNPEPETEDTEFSSSRRAAEAWAESPESWRKVQAEQLDEALTALREDEGSKPETPAEEHRARWSLIRRFQH